MPEITVADVEHVMRLVGGPDPVATWAAIDTLAARLYDHRLFTALKHMPETQEVERLYSSQPVAYPVGGRKKKQDTHWGKKTLDEGELYFCHDRADIERTFFDHSLILGMGIGGMVNVPVMLRGQCVASLSISTAGDRFSERDQSELTVLAGLSLPLVMAAGWAPGPIGYG